MKFFIELDICFISRNLIEHRQVIYILMKFYEKLLAFEKTTRVFTDKKRMREFDINIVGK